jgi:protein phosphatase
MVIDPSTYDGGVRDTGYKGLWDQEEVKLGRQHTYGRFEFSDFVSREHVSLRRDGDELLIRDLNSSNGTYRRLTRTEQAGRRSRRSTRLNPLSPEVVRAELVDAAGQSIASERHPDRNEDALFVDKTGMAIGVFDGVGGAPGSEEASRIAAYEAARSLKAVGSRLPRRLGHLAMQEALAAGHEAILRSSGDRGIATTATIAKVFATESGSRYAVVASVGDSRAYLFRDNRLAHLTLDQAYRIPGQSDKDAKRMQITLSEATSLSRLSDEERRAFRNRNIITSMLGDSEDPVITINDFEVQAGDRLLVTSDGIHDNLTNNEIEAALRTTGGAAAAVNALVRAALSRSLDAHVRAKADDMTAALLSL